MSSAVPAPPGAPDPVPGASPAAGAPPRPPRKRFILIGTGIGVVGVLLVLLLTSFGHRDSANGGGGVPPGRGDPVPTFTATNIGPSGSARLVLPAGAGATPTVLLFFGAWCPACHQELPPLAAAVRAQDEAGGALARIRVIGVDSEDRSSTAKAFVRTEGVRFPVAYDPDLTITEGDFGLVGDPNAVFVGRDGKIAKVVHGDVLTPASFRADEEALLRSG